MRIAFSSNQSTEPLRMHEMAERGRGVDWRRVGCALCGDHPKILWSRQWVCIIDDEVKAEWANVPHFYYNFYVYQYATSFTASAALSEQVLAGERDVTKRYIQLLSSGGSDYPIELLKKAGVDMTTSAPFELTMKKMNRVMDEIELILNTRKN